MTEEKLPRKIEKPWGYELLFALTDRYAGKIIFIKKGHRLSLQYHSKKDESIYIFRGKVLVEIEEPRRPPRFAYTETGTEHSFRSAYQASPSGNRRRYTFRGLYARTG